MTIRPSLLRTLAFTALLVVALYVGRAVRPEGTQVSLVWPAAGVAVWWLWTVGPDRWRLAVGGSVLATATVAVNLDTGATLPLSVAFGLANLVHGLIGAAGLRRWLPAGRLETPTQLQRLLGISALAGLASGALAAAAVTVLVGTLDIGQTALLLVARNGGTTFAILATVLALRPPYSWTQVGDELRRPTALLTVLACAGLYWFVFFSPVPYPVLFVAVGASVLLGTRLGVPTAALVTLSASAAAVESAAYGHGALALVDDPTVRAILLQGFVVLTVVVALTQATLVRSTSVAAAALARQSQNLQDIHDSALVGKAVVRRGDDGDWTLDKANPALVALLGHDPSQRRWREMLVPEDARRVRALVDSLAIGATDSVSVEVRHLRADGRPVWTQLHVSRLGGTQHGASLVAQVADLSERKTVEDRLTHLALHDPLTGLPNRTQLLERLDTALHDPRNDGVGVLFLDLDGFKAVNDRLGHDAGDEVLQRVAAVLRTSLRPADLACRLGGDEFVVCCLGVETDAELDALAQRLHDVLSPVLTVPGVPELGVSIGSTLGHPGDDVEELLSRSDHAMYAVKRSTRAPSSIPAPLIPMLSPDITFDKAAEVVLAYLRVHVPMGFWAVTRVENGRQTYLYLDENSYGLKQGAAHDWEASFCIHMAAGRGPNVAPDAQQVPVYADAGVNELVTIGSYGGGAITEADGTLFGAICGIDPDPRPDSDPLAGSGPLLQLLGQLLSMVLAADRTRHQLQHAASRAELTAETDVLTGLLNRRAWERLLAEEEQRFVQLGDPTVLAMLDLDRVKTINDTLGHAAGDDYIRRAAEVLLSTVRADDVIARLGGDEFGILMRGCDEATAQHRVDDIYRAQEEAGVSGSVGWAPITVLRGLSAALTEASTEMDAAMRERRAARHIPA